MKQSLRVVMCWFLLVLMVGSVFGQGATVPEPSADDSSTSTPDDPTVAYTREDETETIAVTNSDGEVRYKAIEDAIANARKRHEEFKLAQAEAQATDEAHLIAISSILKASLDESNENEVKANALLDASEEAKRIGTIYLEQREDPIKAQEYFATAKAFSEAARAVAEDSVDADIQVDFAFDRIKSLNQESLEKVYLKVIEDKSENEFIASMEKLDEQQAVQLFMDYYHMTDEQLQQATKQRITFDYTKPPSFFGFVEGEKTTFEIEHDITNNAQLFIDGSKVNPSFVLNNPHLYTEQEIKVARIVQEHGNNLIKMNDELAILAENDDHFAVQAHPFTIDPYSDVIAYANERRLTRHTTDEQKKIEKEKALKNFLTATQENEEKQQSDIIDEYLLMSDEQIIAATAQEFSFTFKEDDSWFGFVEGETTEFKVKYDGINKARLLIDGKDVSHEYVLAHPDQYTEQEIEVAKVIRDKGDSVIEMNAEFNRMSKEQGSGFSMPQDPFTVDAFQSDVDIALETREEIDELLQDSIDAADKANRLQEDREKTANSLTLSHTEDGFLWFDGKKTEIKIDYNGVDGSKVTFDGTQYTTEYIRTNKDKFPPHVVTAAEIAEKHGRNTEMMQILFANLGDEYKVEKVQNTAEEKAQKQAIADAEELHKKAKAQQQQDAEDAGKLALAKLIEASFEIGIAKLSDEDAEKAETLLATATLAEKKASELATKGDYAGAKKAYELARSAADAATALKKGKKDAQAIVSEAEDAIDTLGKETRYAVANVYKKEELEAKINKQNEELEGTFRDFTIQENDDTTLAESYFAAAIEAQEQAAELKRRGKFSEAQEVLAFAQASYQAAKAYSEGRDYADDLAFKANDARFALGKDTQGEISTAYEGAEAVIAQRENEKQAVEAVRIQHELGVAAHKAERESAAAITAAEGEDIKEELTSENREKIDALLKAAKKATTEADQHLRSDDPEAAAKAYQTAKALADAAKGLKKDEANTEMLVSAAEAAIDTLDQGTRNALTNIVREDELKAEVEEKTTDVQDRREYIIIQDNENRELAESFFAAGLAAQAEAKELQQKELLAEAKQALDAAKASFDAARAYSRELDTADDLAFDAQEKWKSLDTTTQNKVLKLYDVGPQALRGSQLFIATDATDYNSLLSELIENAANLQYQHKAKYAKILQTLQSASTQSPEQFRNDVENALIALTQLDPELAQKITKKLQKASVNKAGSTTDKKDGEKKDSIKGITGIIQKANIEEKKALTEHLKATLDAFGINEKEGFASASATDNKNCVTFVHNGVTYTVTEEGEITFKKGYGDDAQELTGTLKENMFVTDTDSFRPLRVSNEDGTMALDDEGKHVELVPQKYADAVAGYLEDNDDIKIKKETKNGKYTAPLVVFGEYGSVLQLHTEDDLEDNTFSMVVYDAKGKKRTLRDDMSEKHVMKSLFGNDGKAPDGARTQGLETFASTFETIMQASRRIGINYMDDNNWGLAEDIRYNAEPEQGPPPLIVVFQDDSDDPAIVVESKEDGSSTMYVGKNIARCQETEKTCAVNADKATKIVHTARNGQVTGWETYKTKDGEKVGSKPISSLKRSIQTNTRSGLAIGTSTFSYAYNDEEDPIKVDYMQLEDGHIGIGSETNVVYLKKNSDGTTDFVVRTATPDEDSTEEEEDDEEEGEDTDKKEPPYTEKVFKIPKDKDAAKKQAKEFWKDLSKDQQKAMLASLPKEERNDFDPDDLTDLNDIKDPFQTTMSVYVKEQIVHARGYESDILGKADMYFERGQTFAGLVTWFQSVLGGYEEFKGINQFSSLFLDDEDLQKRKAQIDERFCKAGFGGTDCWTSQLCSKYYDFIPGPNEGTIVDVSKQGNFDTLAFVASERSVPTTKFNDTSKEEYTEFSYTTTYMVKNSGEKDMTYNVYFITSGGQEVPWFSSNDTKTHLMKGGRASRTGSSSLVFDSDRHYTKVCITFSPGLKLPTKGRSIPKMCKKIVGHSEVEAPVEEDEISIPTTPFGAGSLV